MKIILLYVVLIHLTAILHLTTAALWCFQCSWEAGDQQGNNLTSCENKEIEEQKLDVPDENPVRNPKCKGKYRPGLHNKEVGYRILKENCYQNACPTSGGEGGRCAQWIYYLDGAIFNMTYFCAISKETGCFTQPKGNGFTLETCLCKDKDWCNSSVLVKMNIFVIFIPILMSYSI